MHAQAFTITGRLKGLEVNLASRDDFATGPVETLAINTVLGSGWAPYCLDVARAEMVFAHLPPDVDLAEAAFVTTTQYRQADRIATVPFVALEDLTANLPMPSNLIWVFSIGRTGSTLVSHLLNGAPNVWSLSEPEPFGYRNLRAAAAAGHSAEDLIVHGVKLLYACAPPGRDVLAIKHQSQPLFDAAIYHAATPGARYIFLYRDAIGWISSFRQFHLAIGLSDKLEGAPLAFGWAANSADTPRQILADRFGLNPESVDVEHLFAASWVLHLDA